ncbi:unnamed protein product [Bathycoccus prasinos]
MMSSSIILNNSNNKNNNNNNNNNNNSNNNNNNNNNDAGGKTSKSPLIVPMNKKEKTPSSSSPSGTNKKDDNETIVLEEEEEEGEEELPKAKLHEEMMEIINCYNANCLALEADPEKKDNWQSSKKYPGEVLCVKCSNDEKREIAEKKKLAKEKKQAEAKARTTRATSKRPHSPLLSDKHENEKKERYDDENMEGEEEEEEEEEEVEEETEETEDHVPLSKLAVLKGKESTPLPLPRQPTAKSNKKKSKPQWLKDWYSEEWWGRGDKKKFKVYTYEELFNPERKPKLSMKYLEVVEAHIDAFSKNPRFIRLGSLPKQNNFANDRPPPPTRAEEKKKGPVTIHRVRSSHGGTHNKPQYIRRVTLAELMDAELITAGLNVLSMEYRGKEYKANITKNRQIAFQGKSYNEPASFSLAVKRLASPEIKFSNPWTHPGGVKYKDKYGRLQFLGTLREKFFSMTGRNDLLGLPKADSNRINDVQTRKSRTITVTTSAKLSNLAQKSSTDKGTRNIMLVGESPVRKKARKQVPKLYAPVTDTSMDNMWLDSPSDHGIERDHEQEYVVVVDDDDDEVLMKKKEGMDNDVMTTDEAVEIAVNHRDGSLIYTAEKKRKNVVRPKANFYRRFPD